MTAEVNEASTGTDTSGTATSGGPQVVPAKDEVIIQPGESHGNFTNTGKTPIHMDKERGVLIVRNKRPISMKISNMPDLPIGAINPETTTPTEKKRRRDRMAVIHVRLEIKGEETTVNRIVKKIKKKVEKTKGRAILLPTDTTIYPLMDTLRTGHLEGTCGQKERG